MTLAEIATALQPTLFPYPSDNSVTVIRLHTTSVWKNSSYCSAKILSIVHLHFSKMLKKSYWILSQFFLFYLKIQGFRLIMENNFIQIAALTGHALAYTIDSIVKHIVDCVQLYFINGFTNIVNSSFNCLCLIGVALIFNGTPQIIIQRCQIAAPRWRNDISSAADNDVFENRAQNIERSFFCVARSVVLLKPNIVNILFSIFVNINSFSMAR